MSGQGEKKMELNQLLILGLLAVVLIVVAILNGMV
jgi:hypothetical protein